MLADRLRRSTRRFPDRIAVEAPEGQYTYRELSHLADAAGMALDGRGVKAGDRVGVWMDKSGLSIAAMQGALRIGAAYVPLDPTNPPARIATIIDDCGLAAVFVSNDRTAALDALGVRTQLIRTGHRDDPWPAPERTLPVQPHRDPDDLAYILYTSGSTGQPKGVCISERNAAAFIDWAVEAARVSSFDRLSNHAPFHFDLSVFDLYAAFTAGGRVCLVPEGIAYSPVRLVEWLIDRRITVWYSVPSALILMMRRGHLLGQSLPSLRTVVFAGEPFPLPRLRELVAALPRVDFHNWYGPTETNVCTAWKVKQLDERDAVPIGRATCGDTVRVVDVDGSDVGPGELGELVVDGPTVMLGYWGREPQVGTYRTGDLVRRDLDGELIYVGRRDHMKKVRGHRVEPGEIEAALLQHAAVEEAAVVVRGEGLEARLVAFVVTTGRLGLLGAKRHLAERVPRYMIVDEVVSTSSLPRTRNGKVDRRALVGAPEALRGGPNGS